VRIRQVQLDTSTLFFLNGTHPRCGFALLFVASPAYDRSISIMVSVCRHRCLAVTAYDCRRAPERPPRAHACVQMQRRPCYVSNGGCSACGRGVLVRACMNLYRSAPARRDKKDKRYRQLISSTADVRQGIKVA
jgi:hypothetical protein